VDPFVAEIRILPFNFAPKGWAFCDGQLMPLSQNTALFSLLGTTYGGDGKSTFALPNLQGSAAMHPGQGPGLSLRDLGEMGGESYVTLLVSEMPVHTHVMNATISPSQTTLPANNTSFGRSVGGSFYKANTPTVYGPLTQMAPQATTPAGGSLPHNNLQPYLTLNYCIALQGVYPPRT
jgi:microcystin-dependent protein